MMEDRRTEKRVPFEFDGYTEFDGRLLGVKIRDVHSNGLGIFSGHELKKGQEGFIFAQLPGSDKIEKLLISVCWCYQDTVTQDPPYPYRAGLKIVNAN